jgi:cytohesin
LNVLLILQKHDNWRGWIWQIEPIEIMKTKLGIIIFLLAATLADAQTNNLTALLQQGLFEEQANRNLDAAIADYQALARQFDKDRQLAATAVFRLGECYRMQGKTNEAALEYQRILRDFSDQTTLATLSQQDLTGMGMTPAPAASAALQTQKDLLAKQIALAQQELADAQRLFQNGVESQDKVRTAEKEMLRLQQQLAALDANNIGALNSSPAVGSSDAKLWDKVKNLPPDQLVKVLPTLVPDAVLTKLLQQRDDAEAKLAELHVDYSTNYPDYQRQEAVLKTMDRQISERINGMMQALKMRAELPQTAVAAATPSTAEEDLEIRRIQQMIQNSPDLINAHVPGGTGTPLQNAAAAGWIKVATYLLDHGADVNADRGGALYAAAKAGNRAMVELLLSRGAEVNPKENTGLAPLHIAVQNGFQAVVEVLLANKADVNAQNGSGVTPLFLAAGRDNPKIVSLLLEHKADVNASDQSGATPLMNAARSGHPEIVRLLLAADANPNVETSSSEKNGPGQLPAGFYGRTALSFAAESGSPEMVKALLAAKAEPSGGKLDAPLLCAIHNNNIESAELLLQAGAKPDSIGGFDFSRQPGSGSGFGGRSGGIFNGGPVGGRGGRGGFGGLPRLVTPLWLAISENQLPMVQLLLKSKADPNDSQTDARSLLFNALSNTNILEALLDAGAKVDARDKITGAGEVYPRQPAFNWTPLVSAAYDENVGAVNIVLEHGADPNAMDGYGDTALHKAAENQRLQPKIFESLLNHHANPNLKNNSGETPLDLLKSRLASSDTKPEQKALAGQLADLLRQHGALDVLPDWDRITVSRPAANFSAEIFRKGTNDWNQFTLFDLLGVQYELFTASPSGANRVQAMPYGANGMVEPNSLSFPDFSRILIHRPTASGTNWQDLKINLDRALDSGDCAADVPLQFGDVVQIPEADHVINLPWRGLSTNELFTLNNCLTRHLQLTVNGQTTNVTVAPDVWSVASPSSPNAEYSDGLHRGPVGISRFKPVMIWPVLESSKLLLASSDLSRVTVKRRDDATGKTREWTVDCSNPNSPPAFWLRDGDVIEVPGKP